MAVSSSLSASFRAAMTSLFPCMDGILQAAGCPPQKLLHRGDAEDAEIVGFSVLGVLGVSAVEWFSPLMLHRAGELFRRECVEHVGGCEPGAAQLQYAVADLLHVGRVVGIGVDDELDALVARVPQMAVGEIEAV